MKYEITFRVDMATGAVLMEGPDLVSARAVYDYVLAEVRRQQDRAYAQELDRTRIVVPSPALVR